VIGVDLGGTAIKLGRFDPEGHLLAELEVPTPQPAVPGATCMAIVEAVAQLDPDHRAVEPWLEIRKHDLGHGRPHDHGRLQGLRHPR
jgi:hypothetical protein